MVDIMQLLIQVLNIDCSIVTCSYPTIWETLFYLIFFPTVFILLFVYAVSQSLAGKLGVPFRLLIAIAIYIFIVLQGFFTFFVSLSPLWLWLIILIGFLWFIIRHITGGGEGGKMAAPGALGTFLEKAKSEVTPVEPYVLKTANGFVKAIIAEMEGVNTTLNDMKTAENERAKAKFKETLKEELKMVKDAIDELDNLVDKHRVLRRYKKFEPQGWYNLWKRQKKGEVIEIRIPK
ncbi:MAG: hypothetical protein ACE5FW_02800 [Candidatus Aenigmatarchaeota archaeon]